MTPEQLFKIYEKAKSTKQSWDTRYDEVFKYTMPSRNGYFSKNGQGYDEKRENLFSSVGEASADEFVNRIQGDVFPIDFNWIKMEAGVLVPEDDKEKYNKSLDGISKVLGELKNKSNFDTAISECLYDLVAGTFVLSLLEGTEESPFNFQPIPIKDFCYEEGKMGEVAYIFRNLEMEVNMIKQQWFEAEDMNLSDYCKEGKGQSIELLETTYKDYDTNKWIYEVFVKEDKSIIVRREMKSCPFIVFRWTKASNEIYGRGTGLKALPDLKTLNKILENSLTAQAYQLPIFLAQEDGLFDIDNVILEAGAIIPVPSTATGNPSLTPLQVGGNFDITTYGIQDMIMRVQKIMLASTLPADNSGQRMTATEVAQRQSDLMTSLGAVYGRLFSELYTPLIKRMVEIAQKFGYLKDEFDIDTINSFKTNVVINTPVALQLKKQETMSAVNSIQLFQTFDPNLSLFQASVDTKELGRRLLLNSGVPSDLVFSKDKIKANLQQGKEDQAQGNQDSLDADANRQKDIDNNKAEANK